MNRDQLEHAIRAACDVAEDEELWVFGSQAILGSHPEAPAELRRSMEADVTPRNRPEAVDRIDANLGEASPFHRAHGFYVHGIPIEDAATLPTGWEERAVPVFDEETTRGNTGWCLEAHDLAASKLAAFRDKVVSTILCNSGLGGGLSVVGEAAHSQAAGETASSFSGRPRFSSRCRLMSM